MALRPFRFWCQKVLPLVYDDSLSYYELLCKVVKQLNDTGEVVNLLSEYVYDLDINQAVEDKLDEWAKDGTLDQLLKDFAIPDGSVTKEKLADSAVSASKIETGGVSSRTIASGAVTESKISSETLIKLSNRYVTPEMYGAVGDGVTDDGVAVQTAFNEAVTQKVPVYLHHIYKCNQKIECHSGTLQVFGDNRFTSGLLFSGDGLDFTTTKMGDAFFYLRDLRVVGSGSGVGINMTNSTQMELTREVGVLNFNTGIQLYDCYNVEVINTYVSDCKVYGIDCYRAYMIYINGGTVQNATGTSVRLRGCYDSRIYQCDISAYADCAIDYALYCSYCYESDFSFYYESVTPYPNTCGIYLVNCRNTNVHNMSVTKSSNTPFIVSDSGRFLHIDQIYFAVGSNTGKLVDITTETDFLLSNVYAEHLSTLIDVHNDCTVMIDGVRSSGNTPAITIANNGTIGVGFKRIPYAMLPELARTGNPSYYITEYFPLNSTNIGGGNTKNSNPGIKGSVFYETDTRKTYVWFNGQWLEMNG